jgi:hypothetical protein
MKRLFTPILLILTLILTACSATVTPLPSESESASASTEPPSALSDSATRVDEQGAIIFEVTPLNLEPSVDTIEFNVLLTTHSVDLSMDLAATATLSTDTGIRVNSTLWDAPRGGHHVEGKLIFPATYEGKSILEGATKLTLTIVDVDASTRVFEWELK